MIIDSTTLPGTGGVLKSFLNAEDLRHLQHLNDILAVQSTLISKSVQNVLYCRNLFLRNVIFLFIFTYYAVALFTTVYCVGKVAAYAPQELWMIMHLYIVVD